MEIREADAAGSLKALWVIAECQRQGPFQFQVDGGTWRAQHHETVSSSVHLVLGTLTE
jgi:hypothetical protein